MQFLTALEDKAEIRQAQDALVRNLIDGLPGRLAQVGWQGGSTAHEIFWNPTLRFWFLSDDEAGKTRFWNAVGVQDPSHGGSLSIVVEINVPYEGIDRRCGGVFASDGEQIYIAHAGKVGGGRPGIGKEAFRAFYPGKWRTVTWSDGGQSDMILIGSLDDAALPQQISAFVREVARFKQSITRGVG